MVLTVGWMLGPLIGRLAPNVLNINYMTYMISVFAVVYLSSKMKPEWKALCFSMAVLMLMYWIVPCFVIVAGHDIDLSQVMDRKYLFPGFAIIVVFAHVFDYVVELFGGLLGFKADRLSAT